MKSKAIQKMKPACIVSRINFPLLQYARKREYKKKTTVKIVSVSRESRERQKIIERLVKKFKRKQNNFHALYAKKNVHLSRLELPK